MQILPIKKSPKSLDEVDPELLNTFERLGIPLEEQKQLTGVAVDAVMDSVSIKPLSKRYLPKGDNFQLIQRGSETSPPRSG